MKHVSTREIMEKLRLWGECYVVIVNGKARPFRKAEGEKAIEESPFDFVGHYTDDADEEEIAEDIFSMDDMRSFYGVGM